MMGPAFPVAPAAGVLHVVAPIPPLLLLVVAVMVAVGLDDNVGGCDSDE